MLITPHGFLPAYKRIEYWLVLNLMRDRAESQRVFGPFRSHQDALDFHDHELAPEPWDDEGTSGYGDDFGGATVFRKSFKRGSELEWMNPLHESECGRPGVFGHGVHQHGAYYDDPALAQPFKIWPL